MPHSGTNTLKRFLYEVHGIQQPFGQHMIQYWHWDVHPQYIERFLANGQPGRKGYVPLRNPFDISDSWRRRYFNNGPDKSQAVINELLELQIDRLKQYPKILKAFKVETIDMRENIGPKPEKDISTEEFRKSDRIMELREWIMVNPHVEEFYRKYYTDAELWWL